MTLVDDPPTAAAASGAPAPPAANSDPGFAPDVVDEEHVPLVRSVLAASMTVSAAGLLAGGVFGEVQARLLAMGAGVLGAWFALFVFRRRNRNLAVALVGPMAIALAVASVIPSGGDIGAVPELISDALASARVLRPPAPFDPGWWPILTFSMFMLGFGAAWVGGPLGRPKLGVAAPLPIVALTAISQPAEQEFLAGLLGLIPVFAAYSILFTGNAGRSAELSVQFEIRRAVRSLLAAVPILALLLVLNNASFLFPAPVYEPASKPTKPRPIPLSEAEDRVLFEVAGEFTGPWRLGVADVYDGSAWRIPALDTERLETIGSSATLAESDPAGSTTPVTFTIRDLGDSATLPTAPAAVSFEGSVDVTFDPRTQLIRVPGGRASPGTEYTVAVAAYPGADKLRAAPAPRGMGEFLEIPDPPQAVVELLAAAPDNPWDRLDHARNVLLQTVVAAGPGVPTDIDPGRVGEMLTDKPEANRYEIVAAEAMLARWVGVPSRIAFGFDGTNEESGVRTVRPKNSAQWIEVYFEGYGWIPLIGTPAQAQTSLSSDDQQTVTPQVVPSEDVAIDIYIPFETRDLSQLYERIRNLLVTVLPVVVVTLLAYYSWPWLGRQLRLRRRRRWATAIGPRAQIAVEYAELRDLATDLNVGDRFATPLDYTRRTVSDEEHDELAWLVTRALYSDLVDIANEDDVAEATRMAESLRARLWRAQPFLSQMLALVSRASLKQPYSSELPTVPVLEFRLQTITRRLPTPRRPRFDRLRPGLARLTKPLTQLGRLTLRRTP